MLGLVAQTQPSDAEQAGRGFAEMVSGAANWLAGFAAGPNGRYLGYLILIVIGVWFARRIGLMRS